MTDKHAKRYTALGWFFISFLIWLIVDDTVIPSLIVNYQVHHLPHGYSPSAPLPQNPRILVIKNLLSFVGIVWYAALSLAIAALAWMLRSDHQSEMRRV